MVDRESRRRVAELLRHLVAGQITNDQFEARMPSSRDPAVLEVGHSAWKLYDDLHEHKLTGRYKVAPEGRTEIARWILFLTTDAPYEWPTYRFLELLLMPFNVITFGFAGRLFQRWYGRHGDVSVWPFTTREALDAALKAPPYFNGGSRRAEQAVPADAQRDARG